MRIIKPILTFAIIITSLIGDYLVFKSKYSESHIFRAFSDNIVHASIGFWSAILFFSHDLDINTPACTYNIIFCTLVSSLIDIDHVFVAKSINIKDLTSLKQRGIFHCTTFWLIITLVLLLYSYITKKLNIYVLNFMLVLAYTSHHIRDGNRRGLWLYPFGHTPALNNCLYVTLIGLLPHLFAFIFIYLKGTMCKGTVVNYSMIV